MATRLTAALDAKPRWNQTAATVISSEYHYAKWWDTDYEAGTDQSYFVTTFSYIVDCRMYFGSSESWGLCQIGEIFTISFDPTCPTRNSARKPEKSIGQWLFLWSFGLLLAIVLIYLQQRFDLPAN